MNKSFVLWRSHGSRYTRRLVLGFIYVRLAVSVSRNECANLNVLHNHFYFLRIIFNLFYTNKFSELLIIQIIKRLLFEGKIIFIVDMQRSTNCTIRVVYNKNNEFKIFHCFFTRLIVSTQDSSPPGSPWRWSSPHQKHDYWQASRQIRLSHST